MVKEFFKGHAAGCICPPGLPICVCGHEPTMRVLTRRPVTPRAREVESNPRARRPSCAWRSSWRTEMAAAAGARARSLPAPDRHDEERRRPARSAAPPGERPRRRSASAPASAGAAGAPRRLRRAAHRARRGSRRAQLRGRAEEPADRRHRPGSSTWSRPRTSSSPRPPPRSRRRCAVRNVAMTRYHLIVAPNVQFITVHPGHSGTPAGR